MESLFNQQKLEKALSFFRNYSKTEKFKLDTEEREQRKKLFQNLFSQEIDELVISEIIKNLWASSIWANKEYLVDKIIRDNGLELLKKEFKDLLDNKKSPNERYEHFLNTIKGMGPSMITEIICYVDVVNAGIWNKVARKSLAWLEVKNVAVDTYKVSGEEYSLFNSAIQELAKALNQDGYKDTDLLIVDYFLWEVDSNLVNEKGKEVEKLIINNNKDKEPKSRQAEISRHDEVRDKIAQIGAWLGFEIDTEKLIAPGAKVDVIWRAKIANLGTVSYVFEVQDRGSIDSLIVNLQRSQTDQTVQRLVVVSDQQQIEKVRREIKTLPENFRRAVIFWESEDIDRTHENLEQVNESVGKLHLF